ncbi:hypothetical protein MB0529_00661 [Bacteroides fragilis]|jgi:hypothetical protein|nr:hypothetical protein MB0529_00661 [Bacteroides fragilis]
MFNFNRQKFNRGLSFYVALVDNYIVHLKNKRRLWQNFVL